MKAFPALFFAMAASLVTAAESATLQEMFISERRFTLFNSRQLTGECMAICKDKDQFGGTVPPTISPTASPTVSPSASPTFSPSGSPTNSPSEAPTSVTSTSATSTSSWLTENPTESPTNNPTERPTTNPTNLPTNAPTNVPTNAPTNKPTDAPTNAPTNKPTKKPTKSPTNSPTSKPTIKLTNPPTPPAHECVWPSQKWSAITKGDMISGAHNVYRKVAVGGRFINPTNSHISVNGKVYYGVNYSGRFNFNGGTQKINDLMDIPVDYSQYEWLARNLKESNINGKKVIVKTTGKDGSGPNGCYTLYDFRPGGQGEDNGNTLVVFNTDDDICLTKTNDGRQFGPTVLAPFSKVLLKNAGYLDGAVIAKEFTTVDGGYKGGELQLHGDWYTGGIKCIPAATADPTPNPTAAPTLEPTAAAETCPCDVGSDADQSFRCGRNVYVCPGVDTVCSRQPRTASSYYPLTQEECDIMKTKSLGERCVDLPQFGIKNKNLSSRVCYNNDISGAHGFENNNSKCKICTDSKTFTLAN